MEKELQVNDKINVIFENTLIAGQAIILEAYEVGEESFKCFKVKLLNEPTTHLKKEIEKFVSFNEDNSFVINTFEAYSLKKMFKVPHISVSKNSEKIYSKELEDSLSDLREVANFYGFYYFKNTYYGFAIWCDGSYEMLALLPNTKERLKYSSYNESHKWLEKASREELLENFEKDLRGDKYIHKQPIIS